MRISDWSSDVCSSDLRTFRTGRRKSGIAVAELETGIRARAGSIGLSKATPILSPLIQTTAPLTGPTPRTLRITASPSIMGKGQSAIRPFADKFRTRTFPRACPSGDETLVHRKRLSRFALRLEGHPSE